MTDSDEEEATIEIDEEALVIMSEDDDSYDGIGHYDLRAVLRYLIGRNGRTPRQGLPAEDTDSESNSDNDLEYVGAPYERQNSEPCRSRRISSPVILGKKSDSINGGAVAGTIVGGNLNSTELGFEIRQKVASVAVTSSISDTIARRKQSRLPFLPSQRVAISSLFLPNFTESTPLTDDRVRQFCGQFSSDGDFFLSASQDDRIRLYDTSTEGFSLRETFDAEAVGWAVLDTALSRDNGLVAYSSWCSSVFVLDIRHRLGAANPSHRRHPVHRNLPLHADGHNFCVFSLTFSHNSDEILCGSNRGKIYIYDLERNQCLPRINGHGRADIGSVVFADDSSHILFSAGDDGICKVWDRRVLSSNDPEPVGIFAGHRCGITKVDSKNDSRYLITNSKDQTIKLWDMRKFSPHDAEPNLVRWDYRYKPIPKTFNKLKHYSYDTSLMTYYGHRVMSTLIRCYFSPPRNTAQQYIYTGSHDGRVFVYEVLTGRRVAILGSRTASLSAAAAGDRAGHNECVRDVSWHPTSPSNTIVSASFDGCLRQWHHNRTVGYRTELSPPAKRQRHDAGDGPTPVSVTGHSLAPGSRTRRHTANVHDYNFHD